MNDFEWWSIQQLRTSFDNSHQARRKDVAPLRNRASRWRETERVRRRLFSGLGGTEEFLPACRLDSEGCHHGARPFAH